MDLAALIGGWPDEITRRCEDAPRVVCCASAEHAAHRADAMLLLIEWPEFKEFQFCQVRKHRTLPLLVDEGNGPASWIQILYQIQGGIDMDAYISYADFTLVSV